ncbi:hypothetical protein MUK42_25076 [Musa troglodytarum]|uniref:Uncharacterized protein n=1 Tax=Musa troglodytarum TaxID=320322 RepID=A0A9E7LAI8_9LILI|nr:hypothetical protein MUK42_25076 [Musa troglodytarum]
MLGNRRGRSEGKRSRLMRWKIRELSFTSSSRVSIPTTSACVRIGMEALDAYLCKKHDRLLAKLLQPNSYEKKSSLAIVDGFSVEISKEQVYFLGS